MKRLAFLACLLFAAPAWGQVVQIPTLQTDQNGVPVQDFLRLYSPHSVTLAAAISSRNIDAMNSTTRFVLVVCTVACNVAQGQSPATATSDHFQLPANVILRLRVQQGDSLAFRGTTAGTAFVVEVH